MQDIGLGQLGPAGAPEGVAAAQHRRLVRMHSLSDIISKIQAGDHHLSDSKSPLSSWLNSMLAVSYSFFSQDRKAGILTPLLLK